MASELLGTPVELVGRDQERSRIEQLIASIDRGPRFLVIRGEAGIGKTAVWRWAVRRHRQAGHRVLTTQASEEELNGPMIGLIDLFEHVAVDDSLLTPGVDRFERGRRVLDALRGLAAESPVVVAIDDVQWLDPASAASLRYALRRLAHEPVHMLAAERTDPDRPPDDRTIPADRCEEVVLGPLGIGDTRTVVASAVDSMSRPALGRIHDLSGGNPMYAIELARAVDLFGDPLVASVPPTLRGILASRVGNVAHDLTAVLQVAAALGPSQVDAIARATGSVDVSPLVDDAVSQRLLVVGADQVVRFDHPLVPAAVLAAMNPLDRQALHARLADVVDNADARARHLVLSCAGPDADVAAELESAARRAAQRGASALAADLASHCVRITPATDIVLRIRRQFVAILHRAAAGERARALAETDALIAALPPGPGRAEAISMRVAIDFAGGDRFLQQALSEVGDDDLLRGRILDLRGWMAVTYRAELAKGLELGEQALAIAERLADPTLEMLAASSVAMASLMLGRPRPDLIDRAVWLADTHGGPRLGRWPKGVHGQLCIWSGQLGEARTILEEMHAAFLLAGLEFQRPFRILDLALLELASGNLAVAAGLTEDGIEAASDAGNDQAAAWLAYPAGLADTHLGNVGRAEQAAEVLRSRGTENDGRTRLLMAHHVFGLLALASGEPARAVACLKPGLVLARQIELRYPAVVPVLPDSIEATALAGDATSCAELAAELDRQARAVQQPWSTAAAQRGLGLAALAEGSEHASAMLAEAAAMFDGLGYRLDAARSMLLQGRALRRAGLRTASANVLDEALRHFRAMRAVPWAAQTEAELERVAPVRDNEELTPTEARVSELVAAGRRNREIAGEMSISVATVEAHLTRIYRKLHVRSRTELAREMR